MEPITAALLLEEEENALNNVHTNIKRQRLRDLCNPFEMSDQLFKKNFRLNNDAFKYILDVFSGEKRQNTQAGLTPLVEVVAALRLFVEGSYQHGVGADSNVGMPKPTMRKCLAIFLDIIERNLYSGSLQEEPDEEDHDNTDAGCTRNNMLTSF